MKGTLMNGPPVGCAESAATHERCTDAMTDTERTFGEILADVLRVDHLSVDSDFFNELGADSLVMAKFCARLRKRGDLPSISMKDVYRHPTIRDLAAALVDLAPTAIKPAPARAPVPRTQISTREYILC